MLEYQMMCITDDKNMAETRASIDTLTSILKKDILGQVAPAQKTEVSAGYALLPSFQLNRKIEYSSGKEGIAPFALQSTNHALTQFVHLNMNYSKYNKYGLGSLDAIYSEDGYRILDWLSAMINAHVDVAKDPYVIALNINQITYNMTGLLLRGGKGQTTFYFLAQDILKAFANEMLANRGMYGVDSNVTEQMVANRLFRSYEDLLYKAISNMPQNEEAETYKKLYNGWMRTRKTYKGAKIFGKVLNDHNSILPDTRNALDQAKLQEVLQIPMTDRLTSPEFLYQQLLVLKAYQELNVDARRLSKLVKRSQIDTKKFGNNLAMQFNFVNNVETLLNEEKHGYYLTNKETPDDQNEGTFALTEYYEKTFLGKKLRAATVLPRMILRSQSLVATNTYAKLYSDVMKTFSGESLDGEDNYKPTNDADAIVQLNKAVEAVVRARVAMQIESFAEANSRLYEMLYGKNSMCYRLTYLRKYLLENAEKFPLFVDRSTGKITNALLNYLIEYPADGVKRTLDRIVLYNSSMNNDILTEERLISAFDDLLNSGDEYIDSFARDLALYAYLTSYDNPGTNNFFNLVPLSWKIKEGYADAMKNAIEEFDATNNVGGNIVAEGNDNPSTNSYPSISLTIARNLWENDTIVPSHTISFKKGDTVLMKAANGSPTLVSLKNDKQFVKITHNNEQLLYRKVAETVVKDLENEKNLTYSTRGIYVLTPKLGTNDNGNHVYEFIGRSLGSSVFPSNAFNPDQVVEQGEMLHTLKEMSQQLIKQATGKYDKASEDKYELMITQIDNMDVEANVAKDNQDVFIDPLYGEYSAYDSSIASFNYNEDTIADPSAEEALASMSDAHDASALLYDSIDGVDATFDLLDTVMGMTPAPESELTFNYTPEDINLLEEQMDEHDKKCNR